MKVFKPLLLVVLISTFTLTACKDEQGKAVKPAQEDKAVQDLVVKWSAPMPQEDIIKIEAQYKKLDANAMNAFIKANAAYKISQGEPKELTELQAKSQLELNQKSVEKFGIGYNKATPEQLDLLLKESSSSKTSAELDNAAKTVAYRSDHKKNARIATTCNVGFATWYSCQSPLRLPYNDGVMSMSSTLSTSARCADVFGCTQKTGQSDYDYFLYWYQVPFVIGSNPFPTWNKLWAATAEIHNFLQNMSPAYESLSEGCVVLPGNTCYGNRALLLGAFRVNMFMGNINNVANNVRLNPN